MKKGPRRTETDAHRGDEDLSAAAADLVQTGGDLPCASCERIPTWASVWLFQVIQSGSTGYSFWPEKRKEREGRQKKLTASKRVTKGDRAAVDVGAVEREAVDVDHVAVHGRESLVDLEEVDVLLRDVAALEDLGDRKGGTLSRSCAEKGRGGVSTHSVWWSQLPLVVLVSSRAPAGKTAPEQARRWTRLEAQRWRGTHDAHDTGSETSHRSRDVLSENLQPELLGLAPGHEQNTSDAVRDLTGVTAGRSPVTPLGERRADLGQLFLGRARTDAVVLGDEDLGPLRGGRAGVGGGGTGGELECLDREDLAVEAAGSLRGLGALLRQGGELVHAVAGDVEVCPSSEGKKRWPSARWAYPTQEQDSGLTLGDVLRGPAHGVLRVPRDRVGEHLLGKVVGAAVRTIVPKDTEASVFALI